MAKKKVFVSFDWHKDKRYKFLLEAWDANPDFDFVFSDHSSGEIQSDYISRVKAALTTKIRAATHTLVLIGVDANKQHADHKAIGYRNWQNFEIAMSKPGNKLVGVKLGSNNASPEELLGANTSWAMSFKEANILKALKDA